MGPNTLLRWLPLVQMSSLERSELEEEWSRSYDYLKAHGYTLRPRYHPDWKPSRRDDSVEDGRQEDRIVQRHVYCLDATRPDASSVYIKKVDKRRYPTEVEIARFLYSQALQSDSYNHSVPIIDCFGHSKDLQVQYLVMPLLRPFNDPPFTTVKESIDFVDQTLQGLTFMHEHNVAHRDCSAQNIMMDARDIYPNGWHPISTFLTRDAQTWAIHKNRYDAKIKYFFIDFGLSTRFALGEPHLVVGAKGATDAPELSREIPYNPFKLDVYLLGKVFQEHICETYIEVPFLEPLVKEMTAFRPDDRPTAKDALTRWQETCESKQVSYMHGWIHKRGESVAERLAHDVVSTVRYGYTKLTSP